ncbi:hypothetical protein, partial [Acetobacter fallax]|uniref:hypothetical protein n=1 Tax=Acetobacter fallax TaxID=1737473 RepID=UPI001A7E83AB
LELCRIPFPRNLAHKTRPRSGQMIAYRPVRKMGTTSVSTTQPDGNIQWISANALLILGYPILITSSDHIELNRSVIGIAIDPIQYNSSTGAIMTPLTLQFLRYEN